MESVKIKIRKDKKRKDGTCPLVIQIIKNRVPKRIPLGIAIRLEDWDSINQRVKKSHPNSTRLNHFLSKKVAEVNDVVIEVKTSDPNGSASKIKKKALGKEKGASFFQIACDRILSQYEEENYSVAKADLPKVQNLLDFVTNRSKSYSATLKTSLKDERKARIGESRKKGYRFTNRIKQLSNSHSLAFQEIDTTFLSDYKHFCKVCLSQSDRTITNQLIFIRTLYNHAIKLELVDAKFYPFGSGKEIIRIGSGTKIGLSREELERIELADLEPGSAIDDARNVWLFSFYFAGIRISDVLSMQWENFRDGRLFYTMSKNDKPVSLKIPKKAQRILEQYKENQSKTSDFIFPYLKGVKVSDSESVFTKTRNATSLINDYLKKLADQCDISKTLSNHIARHTFGNLAGDAIHPLMLQKLYRHSDLKTTINYQANFIHKDADDALDSVIGD